MTNTVEKRVSRLRTVLREKHIDTFMVLIEENRRYLSAFTGEDTQFDESAGALFVTENKLLLATDSRFELQAEQEAPLYEVYMYREGLYPALGDILGMLGSKTLGFESARLSHLGYGKIRKTLDAAGAAVDLVGTENIVESLRVCKESAEVEAIRKSLAIAEAAFEQFLTVLSPGMTEKEAAWQMEKGMRETGAEALSFPVIAASGPNSALPHAIPTDRRLQAAEPILFDWGTILDGYCSDISRTVILGRVEETFQKIYTVVCDAQRKAIDAVRPGISGKQVDDVARKHIYEMGYEGMFGHGLGHGVGLAVHEPPRLSPLKDEILEPGMVFTVEPGIYIPDWGGIRIENMVVVTEDGAEILNGLDTHLQVIETA